MSSTRSFASDNNAGVHPDILKAMSDVNEGHVVGYGDDAYTQKAVQMFKEQFGEKAEPFLVLSGTGANVLSIQVATKSFHSVICSSHAHLNVHECGGPEGIPTSLQLVGIPYDDGKLTPELILPYLHGVGDEHEAQPKIVSITQATEMGLLYSVAEIRAFADFTHERFMFLHVDGARIANAAVALNVSFKEMITDTGVDLLSFGATKNGAMFAECVVVLNPDLVDDFKYIRKQGMQLFSKMRYVSAQFIAMFTDDLWKKNAEQANKTAHLLEELVSDIPQIELIQKVETNGVFVKVPQKLIVKLQEDYFFYVWNFDRSEVRWMTSWDTTEEDVRSFVEAIKRHLS